jgi:catechol 2,3-dioxygenase-like lactoylglutathione lyase family enzyme
MLRTIDSPIPTAVVTMSIRNAIACVAVKDLNTSLPWYERLVGRGPDRAEPDMVEWIFEQGGRLQLHQQPGRAGHGSVAIAVGNLDTEMLHLNKWGISAGDVIRSSAERTLVIEDPDGNSIALSEMLLPVPGEITPSGAGDNVHGVHPLERALESIAADSRLNARDVRRFLDSLILDLEALLRASEESMSGSDPGLAAQLLQRAHIVRGKIEMPLATA